MHYSNKRKGIPRIEVIYHIANEEMEAHSVNRLAERWLCNEKPTT